MSANAKMVLAAILASFLALTSCGGDEQARIDEEMQASTAARADAERTVGQTAGERAAVNPGRDEKGTPECEPRTTPVHARTAEKKL